VWLRIETVHAVTYFAPESRDAARAAGLRGFWMGYFGFRAAPLGVVDAATVTEAFWGFAPRMVERSIPDAWTFADPSTLVEVRARAAAAALDRITHGASTTDADVVGRLDELVGAVPTEPTRAPLATANAAIAPPADPVARLWQACTTVREHRGDAHVRALRDADLDGCAAHALFAAAEGVPVQVLRDNRGWSASEWDDAVSRLTVRGLLSGDGGVTAEGRASRAAVEAATDAATRALLEGTATDALVDGLDPFARAVRASGAIPYPNPMGLPPVD
jgi:hypothetical protein